MAEVLVLADHAGGRLRKTTAELLTLARRLGEPSAVHIGPGAETAQKTFEEGALAENLPTVEVPRAELEKGLGVLIAFSEKTGLVASNGEARRQIKGGGLKVNDTPVTDDRLTLAVKDLTPEGVIKLSLGRKKHVLLRPV